MGYQHLRGRPVSLLRHLRSTAIRRHPAANDLVFVPMRADPPRYELRRVCAQQQLLLWRGCRAVRWHSSEERAGVEGWRG